jgi:2'-5' RNA ligase
LSQDRIRSFVSVDIDDRNLLDKIVTAQRDLEKTGAQLKFVTPEIMHLTMRFLGEIPLRTVEQVKEAMSTLRFPTFDADFQGLGAFPSMKRINVVWVGIRQGHEQFSEIFSQLEPKLRQIGLPADDKGFSPHLTIARVRSGLNRGPLADYVSNMREQEFGKIHVNSVKLKKSTLTPKGPIYETIHEVASLP